jgi:hypothetical protein
MPERIVPSTFSDFVEHGRGLFCYCPGCKRWAATDLAIVGNIPPGDYTFSIDQWLDYEPRMKAVEVARVRVHKFD